MTAYFGLLDVGEPAGGRHRRRVRRGRRGRHDRRPDRQAQGLPRGRHRRRPGEVRVAGRRARLRRGDRLQGRGRPPRAARARARRHRRLLRQRRRRDPRRRAGAASPRTRASSSAARSRSTTRPTAMRGPEQLHVAARQPRAHGGLGRVRLRRPLRARPAREHRAAGCAEGKLVSREDIVDGGVEAFRDALLKLFAARTPASSCCASPDE